MANKRPKRGPEMLWLKTLNKGELTDMFVEAFFDGCRVRKSAFVKGAYRASPGVALEMVRWWSSFGVTITLHQIRPDLYGKQDRGPTVGPVLVKQSV